LYARGKATVTNAATVLTDTTKNWSAGQWFVNGAPYSIRNVTQSWGREIASNTSNTITSHGDDMGEKATWNNGDVYVITRATVCLDQPGRGQSNLLSRFYPTPVGWPSQALDPVYEWNNNFDSRPPFGIMESDTARIITNRDYYEESYNQGEQTSSTSPFNGTSGNGHGKLQFMPSTCTAGVGYFATDQGSWNQSGSGGQGIFYVCSATNKWTIHYTPYAYPHPLVSGAPAPVPSPTPASSPAPTPTATPQPKPSPTSAPVPTPTPTPAPAQGSLKVVSFSLVNATTGQTVINNIADGSTISLSQLATKNLSIRANTSPTTAGSVTFYLDYSSYTHTENHSPYMLCGKASSSTAVDFTCSSLDVPKQHLLKAVPYETAGNPNTAGGYLQISFTVTN
jgi:hypothetical protein